MHERQVVIVGGGFSGVALAINLLRHGAGRIGVTLVEAGTRLGRGRAYGTSSAAHLLNTPAGRMSLFSNEPEHFVDWMTRCGTPVGPEEFVERGVYGHYVEDTLVRTLRGLPASAIGSLDVHLQARVLDVEQFAGGFDVLLDDGRRVRGDAVVIATGHPPPADPFSGALDEASQRYIRDPWATGALDAIGADDRVLIVGTGLTMIDVVLALDRRGHSAPIDAVSRHGLLPRPHAPARQLLPRELRRELLADLARNELRGTLRAVRRAIAAAAERGIGWHAVVDALRPLTPRLWASMCERDRQTFVRLLRPYWDVHRHRMPPQAARRIDALRTDGRLVVRAARLVGATVAGESILVVERGRGGIRRRERYDRVVNCTGPSFDKRGSRGFERRLLDRGTLIVDPLKLGFLAGSDGTVVGARGPVPGLYLLGPACRVRWWEHTAVPELREQAERLAAALLARFAASSPARAAARDATGGAMSARPVFRH